jgi:hypothetical protein
MLKVPNSKLILISSPYSQRGVLFQYFIESLTIQGRYELPPIPGKQYVGFTDSAGGGGKDAYSMAIAHREGDKFVLDCLKYRDPPFDPFAVTEEFAGVFKDYWVTSIYGDKYTGTWVEQAFRQYGIHYIPIGLSKSEIYLAVEPYFSRKKIELLSDERLSIELKNLERRTRSVGRDIVDHAPGIGRDDAANSVAGALYLASETESNVIIFDPLSEKPRVIQTIA